MGKPRAGIRQRGPRARAHVHAGWRLVVC